MKRVFIATMLFMSMATPNFAATAKNLVCEGGDHSEVHVHIDAEKRYKHLLSCIDGPFVVDMTACAPDGGYGTSYPTGAADLSGVVMRWQDLSTTGGVTSYVNTSGRMHFDGVWYSGSGKKEAQDLLWSFDINTDLTARLDVNESKKKTSYICKIDAPNIHPKP